MKSFKKHDEELIKAKNRINILERRIYKLNMKMEEYKKITQKLQDTVDTLQYQVNDIESPIYAI